MSLNCFFFIFFCLLFFAAPEFLLLFLILVFFLEIYFEETYIFSCDSLPAADESFPNENLPSPRYDVTRITL